MKQTLIIAVLVLAAGLQAGSAQAPAPGPRYNDVQWEGSHNTYQQKAGVMTILQDYNIRAIEFDIHVTEKKLTGARRAPDGDWLVYHNALGDWSNCATLSECFAIVRRFHDQHPDHDVITIFFDMAGVGEPGHTRADLYALFNRAFPPGSILTPASLMDACPGAANLQEAVTRQGCGWPTLDELKGKFILVVSDGREAFQTPAYDLQKDMVFLVSKNGKESTMRDDPNLIFFNMSGPNPFAAAVGKAGFVSRCYFLDREKDYLKAEKIGANHLATDSIDPARFPWAVTSDGHGRPYRVIGAGEGAQ